MRESRETDLELEGGRDLEWGREREGDRKR